VDQKVFISERAVRYRGLSQNTTNSAQHSGVQAGATEAHSKGNKKAFRCWRAVRCP
jgi:hypothetical protein